MEDFIECFMLFESFDDVDYPIRTYGTYRNWLRGSSKAKKKMIINPRYIKIITPLLVQDNMYRYCIEMHDKSTYYVDVAYQLEKLIAT